MQCLFQICPFLGVDADSEFQAPRVVEEEARHDGRAEDLDEDGEVQGCRDKPFKPRKRQKNESRREKAKRLRNTGESYVNVKGTIVPSKSFSNLDCGCHKQCIRLVTEDVRRAQFESFLKIGDFGKQNAYLCGLIHQASIQCRRPRSGSKGERKATNLFHIQTGQSTVRVCKKYFLSTFGVSDGRVTRALSKLTAGRVPGEDLRGKHVAAQKITAEQIKSVNDHISSFPAFQSHYTRKDNPNRKYLSPELNLTKMYHLYTEWCKEKEIQPVKEYYYRHTFNNKFNLQFHMPRKDTCKKCDQYKQAVDLEQSPEKKSELEREHNVHLAKAEKARAGLKADGALAKEDKDLCTLTIDLQKALPFPKLTVSEAYYRRNMYCYNLGVHDMGTNIGYMYVWDETIASRGSQEISACLTKHIKQHPCKHIIIYSDTCGGQNRNINVALSLMKLAQGIDGIETIDLKFMVSGHSYLPNDADFGNIESAAKNQTVYVPDDWYRIIASARKTNKFLLVRMNSDEFLSAEKLAKAVTKRKKNINDDKVNWLRMQWLRFSKHKEYCIEYKYTLNEDMPFDAIDLKPSKQGRPPTFHLIQQGKLYDGPRTMATPKKRDMLFLLKYIPPVHHQFFRTIRGSSDQEDIGPLDDSNNEESGEEN